MQKHYTDWVERLIAAPELTSPEEVRKRKLFVNIVVFTIFYAAAYIPVCIWFEYNAGLRAVSVVLLVLPIVIYLMVKGAFKVSLHTYLLVISALCIYLMFKTGGLMGSPFTPQWLSIPFILAVLVGTRKIAIAYLCISIIMMAYFGISEIKGYDFVIDMNTDYVLTFNTIAQIGFLLTIFLVAISFDATSQKAYSQLNQMRKEAELQSEVIAQERDNSNELLLNILPQEVVEELKQTGKTTARNYDLVTVMFADMKNFTSIVESISPEDLVSGIAAYFEAFDSILGKYDVEKIKTVGDAYICASGLPNVNSNNPTVMVDLALEMAEAVEKLKRERTGSGKIAFDVRFGIHSGPCVAGVVGVKKFAYDIWGDTVNTAARMQQHGEGGKVNISGTTYDLVKHRFNCTFRGHIEVKNKGQMLMYFVDARK